MSSRFLQDPSSILLLAGPCAVESPQQMEAVARFLSDEGLSWMRAGAYKLRTSPYSFQGLGDEGLFILESAARAQGLKTITEAVDSAHLPLICQHADALQIGARNMMNYSLLKEAGRAALEWDKPVLLKRGMAASIEELLQASEYLCMEGEPELMLCERGVRTFETATRFTLDIAAVPVVHQRSLLPICVDVSHPAGRASLVPELAKAAVAAGADALMIELHPQPAAAKSDGPQQLDFKQFSALLAQLRSLAAALGKRIV